MKLVKALLQARGGEDSPSLRGSAGGRRTTARLERRRKRDRQDDVYKAAHTKTCIPRDVITQRYRDSSLKILLGFQPFGTFSTFELTAHAGFAALPVTNNTESHVTL